MPDFKEELKNYVISDDTRKRLTPEQLKALEQAVKDLREGSFDTITSDSPKFDAKGMKPVAAKGPVRWQLIGEPPPAPKKKKKKK